MMSIDSSDCLFLKYLATKHPIVRHIAISINGNGITVPSRGMHLVLLPFSVYPELHTIFSGTHVFVSVSKKYPKSHIMPSKTH